MARRKLRFPNATGPATFVLGVSVVLPWVVRSLKSDYASAVLSHLMRTTAAVPGCWLAELAQAVIEFEQSGWYTPSHATANLTLLDGDPFRVDGEFNDRVWTNVLALARSHSVSVHAAAYLELALRLRLPLATTDTAQVRAATAAGITIYTP